ncbi:MAG: glutamine--fructose-6-phosphate transaminase (isomerizing) [Elusimicrobiaceae bacterium]|jgi:glutamine---fructose-6-phosphate transaminase (isomerizing)|nr:glutamine--fructose-6-phosphate transaminase (isomerizing) [Elusimicrobiaceae bacterium]MBT4007802.1 glutamine--fructose-6-phosphate transaminase (isomerizing) [Elusimicrobiaceae bacterium]MBT5987122.1 glutamine--fructose-6-phosphate transaminase (isomerizing) [Elusimicrobiaceae bacterium]MBT6715755.1 glutamine--fructose-6-phosphate transaminase (isomerizing) [Elusimicrobiaceae bacterium]MBT7282795.1 glutamine--fructose-6-phosphate transaminase (isomerizing) [Elusimicrobiaceae bacterium]
MCGIVGYIGNKSNVDKILIDGLKKLEYRGYDSAGISVAENGVLKTIKTVGKVSQLEQKAKKIKFNSGLGIGHTRWATHGTPIESNSHPHTDCKKELSIVHNGIIENYNILKKVLIKKGHKFVSDTDTEVIAHLIEENLKKQKTKNLEQNLLVAIRESVKQLKGAFAIAVICKKMPDLLIGIRKQSPLIVGVSKNENFLASDTTAVLQYTNKVIFLEDDEIIVLHKDKIRLLHTNLKSKKPTIKTINWDSKTSQKAGHKHFMIKEIYEQPQATLDTLRGALPASEETFKTVFSKSYNFFKNVKDIQIIGCGTAYHAGLVAKYVIEKICKVQVAVDIASEYRYRHIPDAKNTLVIAISQSGETADTLEAVKKAKRLGFKTLGICNVLGSTLTREVDSTFYTHCGPEISVASTKAFTSQLVAMYVFAIHLAKAKKVKKQTRLKSIEKELLTIPKIIEKTLKLESKIKDLVNKIYKKEDFVFLGRNVNFPIALEGALKLKEISYVHAEGFASGEMKHGPIAIIDKDMPVISIVPNGKLFDKVLSGSEQAKARGAVTIAIANKMPKTDTSKIDHLIMTPKTSDILSPFPNAVVLQMFSYFVALKKGREIDQPRNLAKSVTVE